MVTNIVAAHRHHADSLRSGHVVVNLAGRVVSASSSLDGVLGGGVLFLKDLQITAVDTRVRLISEAFLAVASGSKTWIDVLLSAEVDLSPVLLLRGRNAGRGADVLIVVRDISREVTDIPDLAKLFGLTHSEFQIIIMFLHGRSITEIADVQGNSVLTVRTHLKRSYAKLGISSKEQLFAILLRLMAD